MGRTSAADMADAVRPKKLKGRYRESLEYNRTDRLVPRDMRSWRCGRDFRSVGMSRIGEHSRRSYHSPGRPTR